MQIQIPKKLYLFSGMLASYERIDLNTGYVIRILKNGAYMNTRALFLFKMIHKQPSGILGAGTTINL